MAMINLVFLLLDAGVSHAAILALLQAQKQPSPQ